MPKFYVIWIEGLGPRSGEKIESIKDGKIEYTTLLTRAMRIRARDKENMRKYLHALGIAGWTLTDSCFYGTDYAPTGTIFTFHSHKPVEASRQHVQQMLF